MNSVLGKLVTFENTRGLSLDGILYKLSSSCLTVIHVHGSIGNFYQNQFLRVMAQKYLEAGINFLSFNLSGHDGIAEGYRYEMFEYIGGSMVEFEECLHDIKGAIEFVKPFSDRIILQGHSMGCDRVLHYLTSETEPYEFILLSPCDSYQLQCDRIYPDTIENQIARLKKVDTVEPHQLLPEAEYGIKEANDTYSIPITKRALLSIMEGPVFQLIRIKSPAEFFISSRCLVYIGGKDPLQTTDSETMFSYFEKRVRKVSRVSEKEGDHDLSGCELEVAEKITSWIIQSK